MNTTVKWTPSTHLPNFGPGYRVVGYRDVTGTASELRRELAEKLSERVWPADTGQVAVALPLPLFLTIIAALEDNQ